MMFTILEKSVGNPARTTRKYYKQYNNAKTALDNEVKDLVKNGWRIIRHIDEFNTSKGLYCYEYELTTLASEPATLALIEIYTED